MRIGLFLGSFDPIHIGHILNITKILNPQGGYNIDRVCIIPAIQNPWKNKCQASFADRLCMVNIVSDYINNICGEEKVFVSDVEKTIETEIHYSHLVLRKLKAQYPDDDLILITGEDVDIGQWEEGKWILQNFSVITLPRIIRDNDTPAIQISSSLLRSMIASKSITFPFLLPKIINYIKDNNLYQTT